MGFLREGFPGHEGYVIGLVVRDDVSPDSGIYRELAYPADASERGVVRICAGCECGWRSPGWEPSQPTSWAPYSVFACEADEERVRKLWGEHLKEESPRTRETREMPAAAAGSPPEPPTRLEGREVPVTSSATPPTCHFCGLPLWPAGPQPARAVIEAHLEKHKPLTACLGARASGCKNRTNAFETSTCGYCLTCANDPSWKPLRKEDLASSDRVLAGEHVEGHLELNGDGAGLRHFLNGRAVHAGDCLELLLADGHWVAGSYEWTFVGDERPTFHFDAGDGHPPNPNRLLPEGIVALPDGAILRWPKSK